ncbi:ABC transporter ATP-binding protein [Oceanotoga sp. DSM 15011]|uniref:ABC transporter ATP-binding protein n=1 Tax=Oceanotoga TaxID=1255275 RepID=UPI0021F4E294|nr:MULTISPECIES: ABC transporter ATP-binding protein [Oceanotoga]MDN5342152.1 osmoprotectant transport system ATP-binding protein [Oceanotoga sp.]MDO7976220.1 ABC transporter ATP-binding protein [Oceanotoga teriensis]UYP01056.1 ABC transporter ATP-binding protein [Oceanotoga sp. DSM 15011]
MSIKLKNIYKKYDDFTAIENINIEFEDHKITVLIGPSGCGKTTLLKIINKLIERSSGEIYINNNSIDDIDTISLRRSIGYVIQEIGLFPHMTVKENISIVPKLLKWPKKKIEDRIKYLMELVNLDYEININKYPAQLSGGQRQRVGVARGLAADPEILLMDEPFGAIDPINRETLQNAFLEIQNKIKKTIIFVTHDIREAIKLGDKIAILNKGKIEQYDNTINIIKRPKNSFVRNLLGEDSEFKALEFIKVSESLSQNYTVLNINNYEDQVFNMIKNNNLKFIIFNDENNKFSGYLDLMNKDKFNIEKIKKLNVKSDFSLFDSLNIMLKAGVSKIPVINNKNEIIGLLEFESIFKHFSLSEVNK